MILKGKCVDLNAYIKKAKAGKKHPTQEMKKEQTNPKESRKKKSQHKAKF